MTSTERAVEAGLKVLIGTPWHRDIKGSLRKGIDAAIASGDLIPADQSRYESCGELCWHVMEDDDAAVAFPADHTAACTERFSIYRLREPAK